MKILKLLLAFCVIMIVYSCSDDDLRSTDSEIQNLDGSHICGYENYTESGGQIDGIQTRQEVFDDPAISDHCHVANLTLSIDACLASFPQYITAINEAIAMYNGIPGCGINITIVPNNADINVACLTDNCNGGILGGSAGQFYDDDYYTNSITVNTNLAEMVSCCGTFGACDLRGLMVHEIGHVIGLAHTGSGDGNQIAGTPGSDPNSIFNGGGLCDGVCTFSTADSIALTTLYPTCSCLDLIFLRGPNDLCIKEGVEGTVVLCVSPLPAVTTLFEMDGTEINGNCIEFSYSQLGTFTEEVIICMDNGCCRTLSKDIVVFDDNCCSKCYCECEEEDYDEIGVYNTIREEIPCWDKRSCEEIFDGDDFFDCERIIVETELNVTISGDEEICLEDGYATVCIDGLPLGAIAEWMIHGPDGSMPDNSPNNCLSFDVDGTGTYTVTVKVREGDCSQTLMHSVVVSDCTECYCECWEEIYFPFLVSDGKQQLSSDLKGADGKGKQKYRKVQVPIDCNEDCDEVYGGDPLFDCVKKMR